MDNLQPIKEKLHDIFHHLHTHPEVSWKEYQTTSYLASLLESYSCRIQTFDDCTGLIAEIGSGSPVVAVRSDIDALWQEVDGTFRANHSCGHDAHMTIALGVVMLLVQQTERPKGTIRFIFQPAEEKGGGALKMLEKGALEGVNYLYGVHVRPEQETDNGRCAPAILHGASSSYSGTIIGEEAHGARPHLGKNAIEIASSLVQQLATIHLDPQVPYSVKMTKLLAGGESSNIIPGKATFSLDVRAQNNDTMDKLSQAVERVAKATAEAYDASIILKKNSSLPAATFNENASSILSEAIVDHLGKEQLEKPIITSGGEDFHYYALKAPHVSATMLGLGCGLAPGLHHPHMTFDHDAIFTGVEILTSAVIKTLEKVHAAKEEPSIS